MNMTRLLNGPEAPLKIRALFCILSQSVHPRALSQSLLKGVDLFTGKKGSRLSGRAGKECMNSVDRKAPRSPPGFLTKEVQ